MSKLLTKREFAKLMESARQIAREDKSSGAEFCAPSHSKKFQALVSKLEYRLQQKCIGEYLDAFRGYKLDIRKIPGMFSDNKDY